MELVKGELAWPMTECEVCGYNLREATPKASEKSNDENKRLKWTDFCPKCGKGYFVGDRLEPIPPAEVLAEREAQAILKEKTTEDISVDPEHLVTAGTPAASEPSGIPPDKRGAALSEEQDPEGQLQNETGTSVDETHQPSEEVMFWCTKCAGKHMIASKKGKQHAEFAE